jgi:asparagine synthase (glutamine-hydrolysing)
MSGIVGIYFLDGRPVDRANLEGMVETIAHRGADGSGKWHQGAVGLGHRLLWTTPESRQEKLPLADASGDLVITADARVDNREELLAALNFPTGAAEVTDSQLILAAYEKWGERCPEKLLGDFAFAIWDGRRQALFCARDHIGVKPFYYYHRPGRAFVFASEIKAILSLSEVPRLLNETRVVDYLLPMLEDKIITFYQGIFRLPPGHFMFIERNMITAPQPYWELNPHQELRLGSDDAYADSFREIFTEAVRCRLRSAFPVGSLLSGGLDSSSIVGVARKLHSANGNGRLRTFSMIYEHMPESDERYFINAVLAQGDLEPQFFYLDRMGALFDIDRLFHYEDEPFWSPDLVSFWGEVYPAARDQGVRVLLDGSDGDMVVSYGLEYLYELFWRGRWGTMVREASSFGRRFRRPLWRVLWREILKPSVPEPLRFGWRKLKGRWGDNGLSVINRDFARRLGLARRAAEEWRKPPSAARISRGAHWLGITSGVKPYALEVVDKSIAPFAMEIRYPYFDRRLVEFCLALPAEQKLSQGWNRFIVRRALADLLPPEVRWRTDKGNLSHNFNRGLLWERERLEDVLGEPGVIQEYLDMGALRRAYQKFIHQEPGNDPLTIWKAMTLALWLRQTGLRAG